MFGQQVITDPSIDTTLLVKVAGKHVFNAIQKFCSTPETQTNQMFCNIGCFGKIWSKTAREENGRMMKRKSLNHRLE